MEKDVKNEKQICMLCYKELDLMEECDCEETQKHGGCTVMGRLEVTEDKKIVCECGNGLFRLMKVMFNDEYKLVVKTAECKECKNFILEAIDGDEALYNKIIEDCKKKEAMGQMKQ